MALEVDFIHEQPCPCGRGVYLIESLSNDWGRSQERLKMNCEICRASYVVFEHWYTDKGQHWRRSVWITREERDQLARVGAKLDETETSALTYAKESYL